MGISGIRSTTVWDQGNWKGIATVQSLEASSARGRWVLNMTPDNRTQLHFWNCMAMITVRPLISRRGQEWDELHPAGTKKRAATPGAAIESWGCGRYLGTQVPDSGWGRQLENHMCDTAGMSQSEGMDPCTAPPLPLRGGSSLSPSAYWSECPSYNSPNVIGRCGWANLQGLDPRHHAHPLEVLSTPLFLPDEPEGARQGAPVG
jgi:hypothetical protein